MENGSIEVEVGNRMTLTGHHIKCFKCLMGIVGWVSCVKVTTNAVENEGLLLLQPGRPL